MFFVGPPFDLITQNRYCLRTLLCTEDTSDLPRLSSPSLDARPEPVRAMGFRDLVLFYVVSGVSLRWIATAATHGPSSLIIWLGGWLFLYIPLALSVIQLSSRYPSEGGFYVWTKKAFGEGAGFFAAWIYWVSNLPYYPSVLYFAASNVLFVHPALQRFSGKPTYFVTFACFLFIGLTILNLLGLNFAKWAHNIGALAMWIPVLMIVILGFAAGIHFGSATSFTPRSFVPPARLQDMVFWSIIIFSFVGCEAASVMAEEVQDARRNIPRALLLAGITVALCYMLGTFCVLLALPSSQSSNLDGLVQAIARVSSRFHLFGVTSFAALVIAFSNIGAAGAFFAATSRLPFVAGLDGYLPPAFGKLHSRWRTPWASILSQGFFGVLLILLAQPGTSVSGAYNVLVSITVATTMLPFTLLFACMVRLQSHPAPPGSIRLPGGRVFSVLLGCVGFASCSFSLVLSLVPPPEETNKLLFLAKTIGANAFLMVLGLVIFYFGRRKQHTLSLTPRADGG
jgi:amino acid transporter